MGQAERATSIGLVIGAIASLQLGAAVATTLFDEVGPTGAVLLRTGFAAVILVAIWRPAVPHRASGPLRDAVLFGLVLAGMNLSFYAALDRIPLGIAVTLEFTGPLAVAVAGSRRADATWSGWRSPPAGILMLVARHGVARSAGRGVCAARGRASGPATSSWRPGSGGRSPAAGASPWRWSSRRSS